MILHSSKGSARWGVPLSKAKGAIILLHGRGASSNDMVDIAGGFTSGGPLAFLAPNATDGTWYPQRFFAHESRNEPWLSSALDVVCELVHEAVNQGVPMSHIGLVGFSQGGCLALESAIRSPLRYAFVAGLSAALIGPLGKARGGGNLHGTPVLLACADHDPHIPLQYVENSAAVFTNYGAAVTKMIMPGVAHGIFEEEMEWLGRNSAGLGL